MKKIDKLADILDQSTVNKLLYLDRLVRFYVRFLDTWRDVEVTSNGSVVRVKFFRIDKYGYNAFTEREFPMEDIQKRINSYKKKIEKEYENRHDNKRIQREIEIYKWSKFIKECQDSDAPIPSVESITKKS